MAASNTPTSSTETMPVATALSDGLLTMLTPMVDKVDNGIQQAAESQVALSQQIDRVAAELQAFLGASAIPSFSPYAQRLAEVRRRTAAASSTLQQVQARLSRLEAVADRLQAEESMHLHLQQASARLSSPGQPPPSIN